MRIINLSHRVGQDSGLRGGYGRRSFQSSQFSTPTIQQTDNETFLQAVLGSPKKTHFVSRTALNQVVIRNGDRFDFPGEPVTVSLLVQSAHQAFAEHANFSLNPDAIWYAIVHEVAILVKSDPRKYARLFTSRSDQKQLIKVRDNSLIYGADNDWLASINLVRKPLREKMSDFAIQLFTPTFTTSTPESETAVLVTFMDVISKYYNFLWITDCGIRQVRIEGDASDWIKLVAQTNSLAEVFTDLKPYFDDLLTVLQAIASAAQGSPVDEDFWCSLYKYNSMSGCDVVTGWITALFAYVQTPGGFKLKHNFDWRNELSRGGGIATKNFPTHISKVPFVWDYYEQEISMMFAAGIFGVDFDNGFLAPRLGFGVYEQ